MTSKDLVSKAKQVLSFCRSRGLTVATAESCTGGLIAATLTEVAGSSDVVDRGYVTYSNAAKTELLGVPAKDIATHGAVSKIVAIRMSEGARKRARVDIAVSVTGIAGPGGGSAAKPVGLVHLACARAGRPTLHRRVVLKGGRAGIRRQSVAIALAMLLRQAR